jgi:hypothetical protein
MAKRDSKWDDVAYVQYEDGSYETKGSNGKRYTPVKNDKRETAGLGKQLKALGGGSLASKSKRNIAPGHNELMQSARLMENKTNYIDDTERKLFEGKQDILNLIKSLEKKNEDEA